MNLVILNKSFGDVVLFFDGMLLQDYWCETTGYVVGKIFSSGHYGSLCHRLSCAELLSSFTAQENRYRQAVPNF